MGYAECAVWANQINEVAQGKTIVNVISNQNPHKFGFMALDHTVGYNPEKGWEHAKQYSHFLLGKTIAGATVKNAKKNITLTYIYIGNRVLMVGGYVGIPSYCAAGELRPKKHQLLLELDDGSALAFVITFGGLIYLFEVDENGDALNYTNAFPLLLSNEFSFEFFADLVNEQAGNKSIKDFLVTKYRIPGFGNESLHEVLWEAKIHPKSKMNALTQDEIIGLFNAIKTVFTAIIEQGGKDTDKDIFGNYGGYVTRASKHTLGKPCARCGGTIAKENNYIGSPIFYCPQCQIIKPS